jgi:tripartite-type tricarboxylate transporter receptor subunit TctC
MQRRSLLTGAAALPFAMPALAQENFPSRAVSMVVAFPPGGQADVVGRPAAATLERIWRVPVPITNRGGAAGEIGNGFVARSMEAEVSPSRYTVEIRNIPQEGGQAGSAR